MTQTNQKKSLSKRKRESVEWRNNEMSKKEHRQDKNRMEKTVYIYTQLLIIM